MWGDKMTRSEYINEVNNLLKEYEDIILTINDENTNRTEYTKLYEYKSNIQHAIRSLYDKVKEG